MYYTNGRNGIDGTSGCLIESNNCRYNAGVGINGGFSAIINKNNCYSNTGDGIQVGSNCYVFENNCNGNGSGAGDGAGINITGSDNSIERNLVTDNDRGIDCNPATGNIIFSTRASGNTTNYDIADSNLFGAILTFSVTIPNPGINLSNSYANLNF
jgi:parallel beta-helix repeat protein